MPGLTAHWSRAMEVGESVTLVIPFGPFERGSSGTVVFRALNGYLTVRLTRNHEGRPMRFLLPPSPQDHFEPLR